MKYGRMRETADRIRGAADCVRDTPGRIRDARRTARKDSFRVRCKYVPVSCRKNGPVFQAPGKNLYDRSVAWLAGGMVALIVMAASAGSFAAQADQQVQHQRDQQGQRDQTDQGGVGLDRLMKLLAQRKHGQVSFTETDYLAILDRPMKSSGMLVYDAPDHLEKRTLKPKKESLVLDGDQLTVQRGHRTYHVQMSAYPQVAPLVDAMRDTLAGNEAALRRVFNVGLTGSLAAWRLRLEPLDKSVSLSVRRVEIEGERDQIHSVEILQVDGDRSVMTLGAPGDASE